MMRSRFERQLNELHEDMIDMGALCEAAIGEAVRVLFAADRDAARQVVYGDRDIDRKEHEIEGLCLRLLLQQQPVARDLRHISAALKMITDMERIGDQAADIAEITQHFRLPQNPASERHISKMADAVKAMVTESIDAFVREDEPLARKVLASDDEVDRLFFKLRSDIIEMISQNPAGGEEAVDLLMVAKYLERIGDHAENIAEWALFTITGERPDDGSAAAPGTEKGNV